jgi:hypothetical protein
MGDFFYKPLLRGIIESAKKIKTLKNAKSIAEEKEILLYNLV